MRILIIIHGFPKEFEAGSEVYTYNLAKELNKENKVSVFTRTMRNIEGIEKDEFDGIPIYRVQEADRYIFDKFGFDNRIDNQFKEVFEGFKPDIVHINHLNHLSLGIIDIIKEKNIPIVFTLHDYCLICHRGQFVKKTPELIDGKITRCFEMNVEECTKCFSSSFRKSDGSNYSNAEKIEQVQLRNSFIKEIMEKVDLFIAPSKFLKNIFIKYGFPEEKMLYSDYGFHTEYFNDFKHIKSEKFRFGYIGTAIPTKGIHILLDAFSKLKNENFELKLYAQPNQFFESYTKKLLDIVESDSRINFYGRYDNEDIGKVLSEIDVIITPSEWYENSPLVIHEAFQTRVPVITANIGGMSELVQDMQSGLLFKQGDSDDLSKKMQLISYNDELYYNLQNHSPKVISIKEETALIFQKYCSILKNYNKKEVKKSMELIKDEVSSLPIRLTAITSMACNLHCRMCQVHRSPEIASKENAFNNILPWDLFKKLADEVFPYLIEFLPTTMGDPLMTPYFDEIPRLLRKYGTKMNLTTNGTMLTNDKIENIIDVISDTKFSFDGATKDTFEKIRLGAKYDKVLSNINNYIKVRDNYYEKHKNENINKPTATFQVTLQKDNIKELPELIKLAKSLGVDRVKGYHLYVFDKEQKYQSLTFHKELSNEFITKSKKLGDELGVKTEFPSLFVINSMENNNNNNIHTSQDNEDGKLNDNSSENGKTNSDQLIICKRLWEEVWIDHNGDVAPCCVPNRPIMGNIKKNSFREIWNNENYRNFRKGMKTREFVDFCKNCSLLNEFEPDKPTEYDDSVFLCYDD